MKCVLSLLLLACFHLHAETTNISQTKNKLKQLETKINHLQQTLTNDHNKNEVITQQLSYTEKQISLGVNQLRAAQEIQIQKQLKITTLQQQINTLNSQLYTQQQALAKHIRTRYAMGEEQPLKWLLDQDTPSTLNRLLTFYQYIVLSRQDIIDKIQSTKKNITLNQVRLRQEINKHQQLQRELNQHQQKLEQDKRHSTQLISTLNEGIQSNQLILNEYQRNKDNLSHLLLTLTQYSIKQTQHPMTYLHKKLPRPVIIKDSKVQKINQGIVFFAKEGTSVNAVSSGVVVFSDWLKGYGLLLIIDHGQGFMTLYAHNQALYKHKGDSVKQGEQIATVGHSGGLKQNGLYFEIRQRGVAISPLRWLS